MIPDFTLFVPFFNEAACLDATVAEILDELRPGALRVELVLVDDGSFDDSRRMADRWSREPDVSVVRHPFNLGYGRALATGFAAGTAPCVGYMDADLPVLPTRCVDAVGLLAEADLVVGRPAHRNRSPRRHVYSRGYNALVRTLFGVRVTDVNYPFKFARRDAVQGLTLDSRSGFIDAELVVEIARRGGRVREIEVDHQPRRAGCSHFDGPFAPLPTGREALRFWARSRRFAKHSKTAPGA